MITFSLRELKMNWEDQCFLGSNRTSEVQSVREALMTFVEEIYSFAFFLKVLSFGLARYITA